MSLDLLQAVTTGGTVAGALQGLKYLESFISKRNGNGNGNKFSQTDHDTLRDIAKSVEFLHDDLAGMRQDLRDCLNDKRS
jgi:hypothetical protein